MKPTQFTIVTKGDTTQIFAVCGEVHYIYQDGVKAIETEEKKLEPLLSLPTHIFNQLVDHLVDKTTPPKKKTKGSLAEEERLAYQQHIDDQRELINKLLAKWT